MKNMYITLLLYSPAPERPRRRVAAAATDAMRVVGIVKRRIERHTYSVAYAKLV